MKKRATIFGIVIVAVSTAALITDFAALAGLVLVALGLVSLPGVLLWQGIRKLFGKKVSPLARQIPLVLVLLGLWAVFLCSSRSPSPVPAETVRPSDQLAYMIRVDQGDRYTTRFMDVSRDQARVRRVKELHAKGQIVEPKDMYLAAFILHHGGSTENYELAHAYAKSAREANIQGAEWLFKATYDRWMESLGKPQKYGTQHTIRFGGSQAPPQERESQNKPDPGDGK